MIFVRKAHWIQFSNCCWENPWEELLLFLFPRVFLTSRAVPVTKAVQNPTRGLRASPVPKNPLSERFQPRQGFPHIPAFLGPFPTTPNVFLAKPEASAQMWVFKKRLLSRLLRKWGGISHIREGKSHLAKQKKVWHNSLEMKQYFYTNNLKSNVSKTQ